MTVCTLDKNDSFFFQRSILKEFLDHTRASKQVLKVFEDEMCEYIFLSALEQFTKKEHLSAKWEAKENQNINEEKVCFYVVTNTVERRN